MSKATIHQILRNVTQNLLRRPQSTKTAPCERRVITEKTCQMCKQDVCASVQAKKKGFFGGLFGRKTTRKVEEPAKASKEQCKVEQAKQQRPPDPDLSELGGQAYRTCGSAYIVQRPKHGYAPPGPPTKEEKTLKRMEAEPELKDKQEDPMPTFTTVEQRMMDLNERKLHPLYKKYQVTPRRMYKMINKQKEYKTRSGPITPDDYPLHLKFNRELLEKKNMYAEYKKVEPPQQMVAKILEMRQNERPTLERKFPHLDAELQKAKARRNVYDTLNQKDSITEKYVDK